MTDARKEKMPRLEDYIFLNKFGLSILGAWPLPKNAPPWRRTVQNAHVLVTYLLLFALMIPQLLDLYVLRGNIEANVENLCTSLTTFTVLAKLTNLVATRPTFEKTVRKMQDNWNLVMKPTSPKIHRELLLESATSARTITRRYCATMYLTACMYFTLPLITAQVDALTVRPKQYPFCAWYYYDQKSEFVYYLFYVSQVIIGFCCGTGNYAMDSLSLVMVKHLCAQLRIVQCELSTFGTSGIKSGCRDPRTPSIEVVSRMKKIIETHKRHIRYAAQLKTVFDMASLQQLFVSSVIICVIGFKLIVSLEDSRFKLIMYLTYLQLVVIQIYLYCSPGDELISESVKISRATYECPWYELPSSVCSSLHLVTVRSQRPMRITAGNIYVMSIPNFASILKTSVTYLSVLRAMYDDSSYRRF